MKKYLELLIFVNFLLLLGCASRGWQLSEQILDYDNKLRPISTYTNNQRVDKKINFSSPNFRKNGVDERMTLNGRFTKTTFGEPGLLLEAK